MGGWGLSLVRLWSLLRGLERRARSHAQAGTAGRRRVGRWLVVAVWVLPYLVAATRAVVVDSGSFDPIWNGGAEYVALAGVAVLAYVVVVLARETAEDWARPDGPWRLSPWDELRLRHPPGDDPPTRADTPG